MADRRLATGRVLVQGLYANGTNVRRDSDVVIAAWLLLTAGNKSAG